MSYPLVKFGDVVRQVKDKVDPQTAGLDRYVAGEHMESDNLHIRRWGEIGDGYLGPAFHMRFKPGHILYGSRRTYLRKIAVADFEGVTANTTYVLEPKDPDRLLPDFLPFVMSTERFHEHSIKQSKGSVNPYVNFSDIAWYEFPLPPVDEQRRIADLLWAADDTIQEYKATWEKAENLRLSLINNELCRFTEFVEMKVVCSKIVDGPHYPPKFTEKGIPFLLVSNLSSGAIDWSVSKWISERSYEEIYPRINSEVGDVLYTVVGSFGVPVYIDWHKPFGFQRHIALLKPNRNLLDGRFLKYYLESSLGKHQATLHAVGLAQKTITLGALQKFKIPQVPLEKQRQIVEKIRMAELATKSLEAHIVYSEAIKKSLLNNLLQ